MKEFSKGTTEKIGFYVYVLINPIDNKIFYIGKGQGNRVFAHQNSAIKKLNSDENIDNLKINTIKNIIKQNKQVISYIIRYNLDEAYAIELEATLIDIFSFAPFNLLQLTNIVSGYKSAEVGISSTTDIDNQLSAKSIHPTEFKHNVLILNINRTYYKGISDEELYNATRKSWKVNIKSAEKVEYVIARANGILREIYRVNKWFEHPGDDGKMRYAFEGNKVEDISITDFYIGKSLKGSQNPVKYIFNGEITDEIQ
jgi:hypothetical protein